uniref:Uncharacterized protein n=1 Tax=Angiostrongylus cantonensis TaxID=6313 RepID=C7TNX7_ANGCA|nr:hypothetical protein [Angiostrongylus cantonensis]
MPSIPCVLSTSPAMSESTESSGDLNTILFAVFREHAPELCIKYKNKDELYQSLLKELQKHNIRPSEFYCTMPHLNSSEHIEIKDAERLLHVVNMTPKVYLTVRPNDDCSNSSTVSPGPTNERAMSGGMCGFRSHHRWSPRWKAQSCFTGFCDRYSEDIVRFCGHLHNPAYLHTHSPFCELCCIHPAVFEHPNFSLDPRCELYPCVPLRCCHGGRRGVARRCFCNC